LRISLELVASFIELFVDLSQEYRADIIRVVEVSHCTKEDKVLIAIGMPRHASLLTLEAHVIRCAS
jgi:hypothetical protein